MRAATGKGSGESSDSNIIRNKRSVEIMKDDEKSLSFHSNRSCRW